jgi:hypothetical protein
LPATTPDVVNEEKEEEEALPEVEAEDVASELADTVEVP